MSHPLLFPQQSFFYPIGNTSALCLTQDLAPEQNADVLLLGCGDPRNVLFTLFANLKVTGSVPRKLDITCCDWEPAVLARNIILYTMIADGVSVDTIFNIFYHFLISDEDQYILMNHCQELIRVSKTSAEWAASSYGKIHIMCSTLTLTQLRRHWSRYAEFPSLPLAVRAKFRQEMRDKFKERSDQLWLSISRSAGMMWGEAVEPTSEAMRHYWTHGTTSTNPTQMSKANNMNPTFIYSQAGETFNPHYGTFPAAAFHLFSIFAPVIESDSGKSKPLSARKADWTNQVCKQFTEWASSYKEIVQDHSEYLRIRYCASDALSLCHSLAFARHEPACPPSYPQYQWTMRPLELDAKSCVTSFNVIDTSNLMDHLGLLNLLLVCEPLLKHLPSSALYMEGLLAFGGDPAASLAQRLCGDITTISALLNLTPRASLSGFSSASIVHELIWNAGAEDQFHDRFVWCRPGGFHDEGPVVGMFDVEPRELGRILFEVYDQMFPGEGLMGIMQKGADLVRYVKHYTRGTYAYFVHAVKDRLRMSQGRWLQAMDYLFDSIESDRTRIIGGNYLQDLYLVMHLHGLYTTPVLSPEWEKRMPQLPGRVGLFKGWKEKAAVACAILEVPRKALQPLLDVGVQDVPLECNTFNGIGQTSSFSATLHAVLGHVEADPQEPTKVTIVEDLRSGPAKVTGARSLVLSFLVPAWVLVLPDTRITVSARPNPLTMSKLLPKLGLQLEIFSSPVTDTQYVHILPERPDLSGELRAMSYSKYPADLNFSDMTCVAQVAGTTPRISSMTAKVDFSTHYAEALSPSATVIASQVSLCTMVVAVEDNQFEVRFPYPIFGSDHKLRIARKSRYVEIIAPLFRRQAQVANEANRFNPFMVVGYPESTSWSIHTVNLDRMPELDIRYSPVADRSWINLLLTFQFSDRELQVRKNTDTALVPAGEVYVSLKDSFHSLFCMATGVETKAKPCQIFQIHHDETGTFMILFILGIRLDPASFTIIADVAILPLDEETMPDLVPGLQALVNTAGKRDVIVTIKTTTPEAVAWKQLTPAFVERCRTWKHGPNCEYALRDAYDRIPLSLNLSKSPICACGRGKGLPSSLPGVPSKAWKTFRPHATRAAISPLFAVCYLDRVASTVKEMRKMKSTGSNPRSTQAAAGGAGEHCRACGSSGKPKLLACSRCKVAKYCSPQCSKQDWQNHKHECK